MSHSADNTGSVTVTLPQGKPKPAVRFFGTFSAKVASTYQVTLPKALKKAVEEGDEGHLMVLPRKDKNYWQLYTLKAFNEVVENIKSNPVFKDDGVAMAQRLAKSALPVELDSQGRFVLSREFKLDNESNEVVFEAAHTHVRLWTQSAYAAEEARLNALEQSEEIRQAMQKVLDS